MRRVYRFWIAFVLRSLKPSAGQQPRRSHSQQGEASMSSFVARENLLAGSVLLAVIAAAPMPHPAAQQRAASPDFSSNSVGWVGLNGNGPFFEPVPGRLPGPLTQDPRYPFVPNGVGGQPTFRIADLNNPNLRPWVKEHMKKDNDDVLA